jgi:hypothetical protein
MQFLAAQNKLQDLTMDDSVAYAAWGAGNKKALNMAYEHLYDTLKHSQKIKRRMVLPKVAITFVNKVATLPGDFDSVDILSLFDYTTESDVDGISDGRYFEFEVRGEEWAKRIYISGFETTLYLQYIPIRTDLVNDTDKFLLPSELDSSIVNFGYWFYNRLIRDDAQANAALSTANQVLNDKLATLW